MTLTVGTASGPKEAAEIYIGTAGGAVAVTEGWIGTASGARQFYAAVPPAPSPLASISPDYIGWGVVIPGAAYVSNQDATVTVHSGVGPFTYRWESDPPSGYASANSDTSLTTGFSSGDGYAATFRCLVTDTGTGLSAYTTNSVTLT